MWTLSDWFQNFSETEKKSEQNHHYLDFNHILTKTNFEEYFVDSYSALMLQ